MKNVKLEVEEKIQIKEDEIINLGEINKLEQKNIKQNMNNSANYQPKKEIFFSYLYPLFFSLYISSFSIFYREKRTEEKIINRNESGSFEEKKLLKNDLNYKLKKVNIKRKIFKYNRIIIRYIIIINSFILLLLNDNNNHKFVIESKSSKITLKIIGTGNKQILESDSSFDLPDIVYINGKQNFTITNKYYFDKDVNYVKLIWNNPIESCYFMFYYYRN